MRTLLKEIEVTGISLMDGKQSSVKLCPSSKKGIFFYPNGSSEEIIASVNSVISTQNCTVLGNGKAYIALVEHIMAACAFCGIDSIEVYASSSELPILDGSAKVWVEAFNEAGITGTSDEPQIAIIEPIVYKDGNTNIVLIPSDSFKITYCVNFNHPELKNRWVELQVGDDESEIINARTFGYLKDLEKFQQAGMALGVSIDNTVGLTDDGYTVELRSEFEPAKHKILDIVGDLYLTGVNILKQNVHIIAQEAGHRTHVEFAKLISSSMEKSYVNSR